jgi:transposase
LSYVGAATWQRALGLWFGWSRKPDGGMGVVISEVAKRAGVSVDTIRFYERHGLIKPTNARPSGYRLHSEQIVHEVLLIRRGRQLDFTLKEIQGTDVTGITAPRKLPKCATADPKKTRRNSHQNSGAEGNRTAVYTIR